MRMRKKEPRELALGESKRDQRHKTRKRLKKKARVKRETKRYRNKEVKTATERE